MADPVNKDGDFSEEEILQAHQEQGAALVYVRVKDSVVELGVTTAAAVREFGDEINAPSDRLHKLDLLFDDDVSKELKRMRDAEAVRRSAEKEPAPVAPVKLPVEPDEPVEPEPEPEPTPRRRTRRTCSVSVIASDDD